MGSTRLVAGAAVATALAVSGCGGSSSKPLTRAELTVKANAICRTVTTKLRSKTARTNQDIARIAPELAGFEQTALSELSKLVPPASMANDWQRFVAGAQTLAENTARLGEYAKTNNLKAARPLITSSEAVQRQMQTTARRQGLKDCEQVA
jgi:outer membrane murein-binding lipoprotein Lpp